MSNPHHLRARLSAAALLLLVAACADDANGPDPVPTLQHVATHPEAALLSVGGTGPDDVWMVGAQPAPTAEGTVLHFDGADWSTVETGTPHTMWWVHAFEDGPVFIGGGGATVLRVENGVVERTPTPAFFGNTVFGVWGAAPDDVWAVGGFAGRAGFIWHWDGAEWTEAELPEDIPRNGVELPSLFKVWGRASDDVWVVGGLGTVLHWDGTAWSNVPSGTREQLFTVTGTEDEIIAVGGSDQGVLLRGGLDGFVDDAPADAPLLQGVTVDADGTVFAAGLRGYAVRGTRPGAWEPMTINVNVGNQGSIHALWSDYTGALWGAGGNVLSPALNQGVGCASTEAPMWEPEEPETPPMPMCPADRVDILPDASIARRWNELLLDSIRRDIPHPPKHARNLAHSAVAMYDAWAAYQNEREGIATSESIEAASPEDVETAISYAIYRLLRHRYSTAIGADISLDCYDKFMDVLGLDPNDTRTEGSDPVAVGNRIGEGVIARYANDGANEAGGYADTTGWEPVNPPLIVDRVGANTPHPDVWQQLVLATAETQNGIVLEDAKQPYIGAHWRDVEPFAIERLESGLYSDAMGAFPSIDHPDAPAWVAEVIRRTAELGIEDGVMMDISPGAYGNNPVGTNDGSGYAVNPVTGEPYEPNVVPRGDFGRVIAEMWADGPSSETPPGHWVKLANEVSDTLADEDLRPFDAEQPVDRLAWDIGLYLAMGGAAHDAAISAWELKRESLSARPIMWIRWMADRGQRTDANLPSYDPDGLPLEPGLIELITEESSAPGERHYHLRWYVGEIAVRAWPGEPGDRQNGYTPVEWMRARDWIPYQRRTFVTPAFPGFTSGHSTFSRAAAEALTAYTGSPWFPGGLGEFVARQNDYLVFENGPSVELRLQWASYYDAADQAGQSRLWGGIHIWPDDRIGRLNGQRVGLAVADYVRELLGYDAE